MAKLAYIKFDGLKQILWPQRILLNYLELELIKVYGS